MRKRNQIVFTMVEAESEYVHQLYILVNVHCVIRESFFKALLQNDLNWYKVEPFLGGEGKG